MTDAETSQTSGTGKEIEPRRPAHFINLFDEMDRMFSDRWFEDLFPRGWLRPWHRLGPAWAEMAAPLTARVPKVDMIDRDDEVLIRAEVPGVERDGLEVTVSENTLTIRGETKYEDKEEEGDYYRREIGHGTFSRMIALPDNVDSAGARAKFENGVLEMMLPKVEKAKRHTIKIE